MQICITIFLKTIVFHILEIDPCQPQDLLSKNALNAIFFPSTSQLTTDVQSDTDQSCSKSSVFSKCNHYTAMIVAEQMLISRWWISPLRHRHWSTVLCVIVMESRETTPLIGKMILRFFCWFDLQWEQFIHNVNMVKERKAGKITDILCQKNESW